MMFKQDELEFPDAESSSSSRLRLLEKREKYLHRQCKRQSSKFLFRNYGSRTLNPPCKSCQSRALSSESSIISSRLHTLRPRNKFIALDNSLSCTSDYSSGSSLSSLDSLVFQHYSVHKAKQNDDLSSEASSHLCSDISDSDYDSDKDVKEFSRDTRNARMLKNQNVTVIIPDNNICRYDRDDFRLEIIEETSCMPSFNEFIVQASKVVSVEPHGAEFFETHPALIYLPITEKIRSNDRLICLCSNTPGGKSPCWEEMHPSNYTIRGGRIVIKALHFSLFAVVIERQYPEVQRIINHHGGILRMACVPGLEVYFPANSIVDEVNAVMRVFFENESPNFQEKALASPIIMVGPHSYQFNSESDPVTVSLPIPDYAKIMQIFGPNIAKLSVWQSSTKEDEPRSWEQIDVNFEIVSDENSNMSVRFQVNHFSFFKALWDVLSGSLYEVKVGAAYFYSYISFSMMCQAFMEENKDTHCFGLEVICFRSDNKFPEVTNYKYRVGSSLKPKLVRPGVIVVRLKSELFEANVEAGEDPLLIKEEPDFRGREFEKQFACKFKQLPISKGAFGKVIVERKVSSGQREPLFEFNLNKTGRETETTVENSERWSAVAIKNLADTLQITEDKNWKVFAQHIGFTKNEIRRKLQCSGNPFYAMVNIYHERGGTPEEFVEALHAVSCKIRSRTSSPTDSTSSGGSSKKAWLVQQQLLNLSLNGRNFGGDNESDTGTSDNTHSSMQSRKRSSQSSSQGSAKKRRRRLSDAISETMSSSEESFSDDFVHKKDSRKLSDTDMWKISELMNTTNWRALGRTLGLEESILLNIEHAYKSTGFRECSYQMLLEWKGRKPTKCTFGSLYTALVQENLNSVAKGMITKLDAI
ncbi:Ankyrin-2 [Nymphon striatum]|nr:Ankyrin-2 [Nymphon striatum]KAG1676494.1 Ankyrin-2 [Nymphon striatum]